MGSSRRAELRRRQLHRRPRTDPRHQGLRSWWPVPATAAVVIAVLVAVEVVRQQPHPPPPPPALKVATYRDQGHAQATLAQIGRFPYNSNPPTSGPYRAIWPATWNGPWPGGAQAKAMLLNLLVRGNVVLAYGDGVSRATLTGLTALAAGYQVGKVQTALPKGTSVVVMPWPSLPKGTVAAVAWTHLMVQRHENPIQILTFIQRYLHHGPGA